MDEFEQARAYAEADFSEPNERFVALLREEFPALASGTALDLGCGPGDIAMRLAQAVPQLAVHGVDGSGAMLDCARRALARRAGLGQRVVFIEGILPGCGLPLQSYDAVISNSLLHHLHDPQVLWRSVLELGRPGAPVLVMDLFRPRDAATARGIVEQYAADEPEVLRQDFYNSLLAAFEPEEVRAQLREAGLDCLEVRTVSDRHLVVAGHLPG
jgi:ubiquinone/menaquinone biosynthesis C-methylase UbiE